MSYNLKLIPLNKLSESKLNVRKTNRKADIETLAASIAAHGLLQNLSVIPKANDRYDVVAGARRLAALRSLAASGALPKDFAVPCQILTPEDAGEASLAENIQRISMDAMDEVEAFASFSAAGSSVNDIARRFGCGARHVEQRLALARLSPKLKAAYRRGDLSLDAARAFCIVDDHAKQDSVFKALGSRTTHAASVRNHLMQGAMRAQDRIARFVGLDAYEAAGGHVTRDLFNDNEAYVDDPALMMQLAHDRLDVLRAPLLEKGWGWVNINLGFGRFEGGAAERLHPTRRAMTDEERAALTALDAQAAALEEDMDDADDDDRRWSQLNDLAAQRLTLMESLQEWDPELIRLSGVVISIDHDARPAFACGIVSKEDAAKFRRLRNARAAKPAHDPSASPSSEAPQDRRDDDPIAPWEEPISDLPKALTRELTEARTRAIQAKLSENADLALAVTVFAMTRSALVRQPIAGIGIELHGGELREQAAFVEARGVPCDALCQDADAALSWCIAQPRQALLDMLAVLVTGSVDLTHDGASREDARKQRLADRLAISLDLDMRHYWQPDLAFWSRLSKAALIRAHLSAPGMAGLSSAEQAAFQKAQSKCTKDSLAKSVAEALDGAGWLPDVLIAPDPSGALEVTESGRAAIAAE